MGCQDTGTWTGFCSSDLNVKRKRDIIKRKRKGDKREESERKRKSDHHQNLQTDYNRL